MSVIGHGVEIVTSGTRPASPFDGMQIYETDTKKVLVYNGSAWVEVNDLDNTGGLSDGAYNSLKRLDFKTRTSSYTATTDVVASAADIFSSDLTFTADGTSNYIFEFWCYECYTGTATSDDILAHFVNGSGTDIFRIFSSRASILSSPLTRKYATVSSRWYYTPSAGSVSFNIRAIRNSATNNAAMLGTADNPMFFSVYGPVLT